MKYILLIPTGLSDEPIPSLDGKTPLEAAQTPNMDYLAKTGRVGNAQHTPKKFYPGTDVPCLSALGYDPDESYTGRGALEAAHLGVRVKMITGDSAEVAESVARQTGLLSVGQKVIVGDDWEGYSSNERYGIVEQYSVFARISPQQKYEIIETLQKKYEVGFLGDGVNDAPALSLAHVALAVQGASGIARESADVLLLDASLSVIVDGIREGREIFANMNKYLKSMLASNFGNFYSIALVSLFIPFVPMLPIQILLIDILSDLPMLAQAGDRVEFEDLRRPHHYDVRGIVLIASLLGVVSSVFDFILFASFYRFPNEGVLQTNWFVMSLMTEVVLIYSVRTRKWFFQGIRPSGLVIISSILTILAAGILPFVFIGQHFFHFVPPTIGMLAWMVFLVVVYFIATELVKHWYYRMKEGSRWGVRTKNKIV
jgi:Mg2+-importing ATPase